MRAHDDQSTAAFTGWPAWFSRGLLNVRSPAPPIIALEGFWEFLQANRSRTSPSAPWPVRRSASRACVKLLESHVRAAANARDFWPNRGSGAAAFRSRRMIDITRRTAAAGLAFTLAAGCATMTDAQAADLILVNGKFATLDREKPNPEAVAIRWRAIIPGCRSAGS